MEKVHFSTYLSFFQTSGSSELYEDNEIFVKQFKLFFLKKYKSGNILNQL